MRDARDRDTDWGARPLRPPPGDELPTELGGVRRVEAPAHAAPPVRAIGVAVTVLAAIGGVVIWWSLR